MAIHADWPAYPAEHGIDVALWTLGMFPQGTVFKAIDDIDRCHLFVVDPKTHRDDFDEANYHVALWHADLVALANEGLAKGIRAVTELEHAVRAEDELRQELKDLRAYPEDVDPLDLIFIKGPNDEHIPVPRRNLEELDDQDTNCAVIDPTGLAVTDRGHLRLLEGLQQSLIVPEPLAPRLQPLLQLGLFDTAVRELSVALETQMRESIDSSKWGQRLIDDYVRAIANSDQWSAAVKLLRCELRTTFKYIRNEFAHKAIDLGETQGLALVARLSALYAAIQELNPRGTDTDATFA